jgi:hypothetical protein
MYLGSLMTGNSNVAEQVKNCLIAAKRSYFGLQSHFKSQLLSRKTKILIFKTLSVTITYLHCRILDYDKKMM